MTPEHKARMAALTARAVNVAIVPANPTYRFDSKHGIAPKTPRRPIHRWTKLDSDGRQTWLRHFANPPTPRGVCPTCYMRHCRCGSDVGRGKVDLSDSRY